MGAGEEKGQERCRGIEIAYKFANGKKQKNQEAKKGKGKDN